MKTWGDFLSEFRTTIIENVSYIPKYPDFENIEFTRHQAN